MEQDKINKIYEILNKIPITEENNQIIEEIKQELLNNNYIEALKKKEELSNINNEEEKQKKTAKKEKKEEKKEEGIYPKKLSNKELEQIYMGLLLTDPKLIVKYYFLYEDCFFEDEEVLNAYKSVLFTEGGAYTPEVAKNNFNFAKDTEESYKFKNELRAKVENKKYNMEKVYEVKFNNFTFE